MSIVEGEPQAGNNADHLKDDYIPPNRRMMLKCKQKDKWIVAEDDELRFFRYQ
jgi:hypothetical protein